MSRIAFILLFVAFFFQVASLMRADVAPPTPEIARNPVLPNDRQPAFAFTIAAGFVLTGAILGVAILARTMRIPGPLGALAAAATVVVWIAALWMVRSEQLRAAREQEELTNQADREWADWEMRKRNRRHRGKPQDWDRDLIPAPPVRAAPMPSEASPEM